MGVFLVFSLYTTMNQRSIMKKIIFLSVSVDFFVCYVCVFFHDYQIITRFHTGNANVLQQQQLQQQAAMQLQIAAQQAEEGAAGGGGSGSPSIPTNGDLPPQHAPPLQVSGKQSFKLCVCALFFY
jgi:hypothetical protein